MKPKITIYSDGAASPNPGYGGWGCVILTTNRRKELSGSKRDATNNQMEMMAALRALQALTKSCDVTLYTDSRRLMCSICSKSITQYVYCFSEEILPHSKYCSPNVLITLSLLT